MTVRYERPVSRAAYFSRRLALLACTVFLIAWGLHRFHTLETPYFFAVALAAAALAVAAIYFAAIGLAMLWTRGAKGGTAAVHALLLGLLPLVPTAIAAANYVNRPPVYDISTDAIDPPQWIVPPEADQSWLGPREEPAREERQKLAETNRGLTGRRYEGALDRVYTAARNVALARRIQVVEERGAPQGAIDEFPRIEEKEEAVADSLENVPVPLPRPLNEEIVAAQNVTTGDAAIQGFHRELVFGLESDIVIRLREELETTLVDVRVAARYGKHDLGTGARLIEQYLRALDAELLGIAGD